MFKEKLLIGQYYPADSPIHRLDARGKILATLLYMVALFIAKDWWGYGFLLAFFLVYTVLSRIPFRALWRGMKIIIIFCLITMVLNMFLYPGEEVWSWRFLTLTKEGIVHGAAMGLRLLLLVVFASLLTLTTTPIELTDGLERLLTPFRRLGVPAHEIAMMMSIALRFIPTILEEFDRIMLAQRARGANLAKGNLFRRVAAVVPLLVPLFVAAFRRADELAQAMEAKCYHGGEGRSRWKTTLWRPVDSVYLAIFILIILLLTCYRIFT